MRNLVEYPITHEEIDVFLENLRQEIVYGQEQGELDSGGDLLVVLIDHIREQLHRLWLLEK